MEKTTTANPNHVGILGYGPAGRQAGRCFQKQGYKIVAYDRNTLLPGTTGQLSDLSRCALLVPTSDEIILSILERDMVLPTAGYVPYQADALSHSLQYAKTGSWSVAERLERGAGTTIRMPQASRVKLTTPPWLIRPLGGAGGGGQFWVEREHDMGALVRSWEAVHGRREWIVAPDLRGLPDLAVDLLFDRAGKAVYSFVRKRVDTLDKKNRPSGLSSSARIATCAYGNSGHRDRIRGIAIDAVKSLTRNRAIPFGPYGVDMRGDYVVEVNCGRFNTSAWAWSLACDNGFLARLLYNVTVREPADLAVDIPEGGFTERDVAHRNGKTWLLIEPGHDPIAYGKGRR